MWSDRNFEVFGIILNAKCCMLNEDYGAAAILKYLELC